MEEKVCTACTFCKSRDYGYSNYTVDGTNYECLFDIVAFGDEETQEGREKKNRTAETCQFYREGTGIYIDCDGEQEQESIRDWIAIHFKSLEPKP